MLLKPSTEQIAMARTIEELVIDWLATAAAPREQWRQACGIGLHAVLRGQDLDGLGLQLAETIPVLRALGPVAADWPWAATIAAAGMLAPASGDTAVGMARQPPRGRPTSRLANLLDEIAILGSESFSVTSAREWQCIELADLAGESRLFAAPSVVTSSRPCPDSTRILASVRTAEAALLLGVADHALRRAVDHARQREQFGRPIGSFQAVKHLLAATRTDLAFAEPLVLGAAVGVDHGRPTAPRDAAAALLSAGEVAHAAVRASIQVHGAIGYTDELPLGRLLAAVRQARSSWGSAAELGRTVDRSLQTGAEHLGDGRAPLNRSDA